MSKTWFQQKEVMAGAKRLLVSYYIYKIFGKFPLRLIASCVSLCAFVFSKEKRGYSKKYFKALEKYTNKKYPILISSIKQFLNYSDSLADRIISFSGNLKADDFEFIEGEKEIYNYLSQNKGIFFLTTHIGNAEILEALLNTNKNPKPKNVNIFLEKRSCEVFNSFIEKIKKKTNTKTYAVEDVGVDTAIELSKKIADGELIFMAGDRLAYNNSKRNYKTKLLNQEITFPIGALKLAQILNCPIFFIVCVKEKSQFKIFAYEFISNSTNKKDFLEDLKKEFGAFVEKYTIKYPYQFFNFYEIFK